MLLLSISCKMCSLDFDNATHMFYHSEMVPHHYGTPEAIQQRHPE